MNQEQKENIEKWNEIKWTEVNGNTVKNDDDDEKKKLSENQKWVQLEKARNTVKMNTNKSQHWKRENDWETTRDEGEIEMERWMKERVRMHTSTQYRVWFSIIGGEFHGDTIRWDCVYVFARFKMHQGFYFGEFGEKKTVMLTYSYSMFRQVSHLRDS